MSDKFCCVPWKELYITSNGSYGFCCLSDQNAMQHPLSLEHSFDDHWNGHDMRSARLAFLQGQDLPQCRPCWQEEDTGKTSGRMRRNQQYLKTPDVRLGDLSTVQETRDITNQDGSTDAQIQGLFFSVGNDCQLRCVSCSPSYSRSILKDYEKLGWDNNFSTRRKIIPVDLWKDPKKHQHNLWTRLKEIVEKNGAVRFIRITGGEPTLSKPLLEFFDWYQQQGHAKETFLFLNTNAVNIKPEFIQRLESFRQVNLSLSVDGVGAVDEYLRFPTNWDKKEKIIDQLAQSFPHSSIHTTVYSLNVGNLDQVIKWAETKPIGHSLQTVFYPDELSVKHLPDDYKQQLIDQLKSYLPTQQYQVSDNYQNREFRNNNIASVVHQLQQPRDESQWQKVKKIVAGYDSIRRHKLTDIVPSLKPWLD